MWTSLQARPQLPPYDDWRARFKELSEYFGQRSIINNRHGNGPAVVFQIVDSTDILFEFAKLELRLAAIRAWSLHAHKDGSSDALGDSKEYDELHNNVAWCGLSFPDKHVEDAAKIVVADRWFASTCPNIASMMKCGKFTMLCHQL